MSVSVEDQPAGHSAEEILVGFTTALRSAGVPLTPDRSAAYLDAVALLGLGDREATRCAGRATLCGTPEDLARHDRVFEEWFGPGTGTMRLQASQAVPSPSVQLLPEDPEPGSESEPDDLESDPVRAAASAEEVLRHRDIAALSPAERARLATMFATLPVRLPTRPAARRTPHHRGEIDASRTLRASLRRMGEPDRIHRRRREARPRRVVLLVDVSGSMSGYADALLRLAHHVAHRSPARSVETFTVGTRLTHLTRSMRALDPDRAIAAAGEVVPDWSGGTRLGESLKAFTDRHGQRGMARGAVVVIFSDGWERGDPQLLGDQVARLDRLAHRVIWVNPHRGKEGYAPIQGGIVAVLPYVDTLVAGHSLAAFAEVLQEIAR